MDPSGKTIFTTQEQIDFAWRNFEDQQAIIRAADLKAGYLVTFLLFFGASTIPLGKDVIPKLNWASAMDDAASAVYLLTYLGLVIAFVWSLVLISRALTPHVAKKPDAAPKEVSGLLYYEHVNRYKDGAHYFEAVSSANPELILRNVTEQVYALSKICKAKMDSLRAFAVSFKWTVVTWCVSTGIGFWIIGRK